ncbi:MAG: hypothetical protein J7545_10650 [Roseofilum sp. SBFL]|uniref:hypothetical protein n=1 Tax=unclassified Roseofilum TaxID=2620099 RepID=UPI001B1D9A19|nr:MULTISPECIES: hypothetical protein [unclassified Roseofilum]MBP0014133.1 hypothetical protein [Roseofilum sp. SID3]MBP0024196.1 hypothetical protein [Roseofilum sp. SID2]MBP0042418.1 hypothetical protein [Roseofilum sp. SBFL]
MSEDAIESAKLSLYAFHLSHDATSGEEQRTQDSDRLWETFAQLGKHLHILSLANFRQFLALPKRTVVFQELLSDEIERCLRFSFPSQGTHPRHGELYGLQIHDTYAADLTFHYRKPISVEDLTNLNPEGKLLANSIQASLGQTLVLFAKPQTDLNSEQLKELSDRCLDALVQPLDPSLKPSYLSQGKLLGSPIFEYDNFAKDPQQSCHVLIWLNTHPETKNLEESGEYYHPLINLLCSRSKIVLSYFQAGDRHQEARKVYQELEQQANILKGLPENREERLKFLKKALVKTNPEAFTYATHIRDIKDHHTAIATNLRNYTQSLQVLKKIPGEHDLKNFQDFEKQVNQYLNQIQTYLNYLVPGQDLFSHCISTMRGIVEIEQAEINNQLQKQETDLQNEIQAIGVGIAAGAIVASTSGLMTEPWDFQNPKQLEGQFPLPFLIALVGSFLCSFSAWKLARRWIKHQRN